MPRSPLLLLCLSAPPLLLLLGFALARAADTAECFQGVTFEEILQTVELPSCLAKGSGENCTVMQHLQLLAAKENKDLKQLVSRVTILLMAHSDFAKELSVPGNPGLEAEETTAQHLAFFAVTKCIRGKNFCHSLRLSCRADTDSLVFLLSGHCSDTVRCVPISSDSEQGNHTELLNMMDYLQFRMLERQLFIAKDIGEVQLGVSSSNEFLVQSELNDTHGETFSKRPVAMFVPWRSGHLGYYNLFSHFLHSALSLKDLFSFHVVTIGLSSIPQEQDRLLFRRSLQDHEAFLGLYTDSHCGKHAGWAFNCQPIAAKASKMLSSQQISAFLLHELLKQQSLAAPFPAFSELSPQLTALVKNSDTYLIAVVPVKEMLTDKMLDWENFRILASYLSSSFSVTYYPVILTTRVAVELLKDEETGMNLEETLERPCSVIRFPGGAGFTVLNFEEPVMLLESVIRSASDKTRNFRVQVKESMEYLHSEEKSNIPERLTGTGHFAGNEGFFDSSSEVKEMMKGSVLKGRVDAFVEQWNFKEVYNVSGIRVVESEPGLMENFFDTVGKDKPWLVVFIVSWSPLCKAARAIWSSVGQCVRDIGLHDVQLAKVDCFEANEVCNKLHIQEYPTIGMFSNGKLIGNYTGAVSIGDVCMFANVALQSPVLTTQSELETRQLVSKFLPLKSRVFVFEGEQPPEQLTQLATELHPNELFVHQKRPAGAQLTAVYKDTHPETKTFEGSLDSIGELREFVRSGHLDSVFPCTWSFLPQALARDKPLVVLFHTAQLHSSLQLLKSLHSGYADRSSICTFDIKKAKQLADLVEKVAGTSVPALVAIAKPPTGTKKIYRLPLGSIRPADLLAEATTWLDKALGHQLAANRSVEPLQRWQPASVAYNFVDEVYLDKRPAQQPQRRSNRLHSPDPLLEQDERKDVREDPGASAASAHDEL